MSASREDRKVLHRTVGSVGWLTLNNPERRNAISFEMWPLIAEAIQEFGADPNIRVVVIHGAGGKAFASGADISQFAELRNSAAQEADYRRQSKLGRDAMDALEKPLIAMIDGFCIGGGLALALGADLRICSTSSQFGIPAARLGVAYAIEPIERLTRLVGLSRAKDILFTARRLSSEEALAIGLVNRVVSSEHLLDETTALANQIAENAPLSVRASKVIINESARDDASRDAARIASVYEACFDSHDYEEGRRAFLEKRAPRFDGV